MDTGAGTLSFELDGRPLGVAFDGIFGTPRAMPRGGATVLASDGGPWFRRQDARRPHGGARARVPVHLHQWSHPRPSPGRAPPSPEVICEAEEAPRTGNPSKGVWC